MSLNKTFPSLLQTRRFGPECVRSVSGVPQLAGCGGEGGVQHERIQTGDDEKTQHQSQPHDPSSTHAGRNLICIYTYEY